MPTAVELSKLNFAPRVLILESNTIGTYFGHKLHHSRILVVPKIEEVENIEICEFFNVSENFYEAVAPSYYQNNGVEAQ